jgi:hypothetical protein
MRNLIESSVIEFFVKDNFPFLLLLSKKVIIRLVRFTRVTSIIPSILFRLVDDQIHFLFIQRFKYIYTYISRCMLGLLVRMEYIVEIN